MRTLDRLTAIETIDRDRRTYGTDPATPRAPRPVPSSTSSTTADPLAAWHARLRTYATAFQGDTTAAVETLIRDEPGLYAAYLAVAGRLDTIEPLDVDTSGSDKCEVANAELADRSKDDVHVGRGQ